MRIRERITILGSDLDGRLVFERRSVNEPAPEFGSAERSSRATAANDARDFADTQPFDLLDVPDAVPRAPRP